MCLKTWLHSYSMVFHHTHRPIGYLVNMHHNVWLSNDLDWMFNFSYMLFKWYYSVLSLTTVWTYWEDFTCLDVTQCLLNKTILNVAAKYIDSDISGCLGSFLALGTKVYFNLCSIRLIQYCLVSYLQWKCIV